MVRQRVAVVLDLLAVALLVLLAVIIDLDGFILRVAGIRISFRSVSNPLAWLAVVGCLRLVLFRSRGLVGYVPALWRRLYPVRVEVDLVTTPVAPGFWRRTLLASLGIGGVVVVLLHDQFLNPYSVPDHGDPLFSIWRIDQVLRGLVSDPANLFDGNIFHPERLTLTLSDPLILPAIMAAPLLGIGVHPVITYNVMLFLGFWLSGVATHFLVERLTGSAAAAFVAGLLYACAAFRFDHYSHLELQMTQWMPLGLLALHLLVSTGRWRYAAALGVMGVAQLYSAMYYAVFFLLYAAVVGVGLLLLYRSSVSRLVKPVAVTALVAGLCAVPIAFAFNAAAPIRGERSIGEVQFYSAQPADYLQANTRSASWATAWPEREVPSPERALFPGAVPIALAAIGLAPPFTAASLVYGAGLIVSVDLSLGLNGFAYQYLHRWLSPVRGLRSPARFIALVALTLSILGGLGARRLLQLSRGRGRWLLVAGLTLAIGIDAWPTLILRPVWKEPPGIYASVPEGAVLAELPTPENEALSMPFMYFSLWHNAAMVNGYSGNIPASYLEGAKKELMAFPQGESVDALRRRGVTHITANCGLQYAGCDDAVRFARVSPDLRIVVEQPWEGGLVGLYEIIRR